MTIRRKTLRESRKLEETLMRKSQARLRSATINVGTFVSKSAEVTETVGRRRADDVVAFQKVRCKNEGVEIFRGDNFEYFRRKVKIQHMEMLD